jgi:RNA polymerase sigma-70 factor (ECF subfamily)
MPELTDHALILGALRGEVQAYGELVNRYQASVYNVCYRLMGERQAAEDRAQDAFVRAYQRLETFDVERPFGPWIRRVATNVCLNDLNRAGPFTAPLEEEFGEYSVASLGQPEKELQRAETAESVQAALSGLPPHYRAVIELRHYQELSYAEIAAALGLTMSEVKTHLYRARKALAERFRIEGLG